MIQDLIEDVENGSIWADLMLVSTPYTLGRRLDRSAAIRDAKKNQLANLTFADQILRRAIQLFERPSLGGFLHPDDRALSTYLYILAHDPDPRVLNLLSRVASGSRLEFMTAIPMAQRCIEQFSQVTVSGGPNWEELTQSWAASSQSGLVHTRSQTPALTVDSTAICAAS